MPAKIIIIPRDRLAWHKQMAEDSELPHVAVRVGVCIGGFFNNRTGRTFVGYDRIASDLAISRATAMRAVRLLIARRHLNVEAGGGRRMANRYSMILNTVSPVTPFDGGKTVANSVRNSVTSATPTPKDTTYLNSASPTADPVAHALGDAGDLLKRRIGKDVFASWFGKVAIETIADDVIVLTAPTRFIKEWIKQHFDDALYAAFRHGRPALTSVQIKVKGS